MSKHIDRPDDEEVKGDHEPGYDEATQQFFEDGEKIGTPNDPNNPPRITEADLVDASPEVLEAESKAFYDKHSRRSGEFPAVRQRPAKTILGPYSVGGEGEFNADFDPTNPGWRRAPDEQDDTERVETAPADTDTEPRDVTQVTTLPPELTQAPAEPEGFARIPTPRVVALLQKYGPEEDGETKFMREKILAHLLEINDDYIIMSRQERAWFTGQMDALKKDATRKNVFKELAIRLFKDPEVDKEKWFNKITTEQGAEEIYDTYLLASYQLQDLIQLTIRKKVDKAYVMPYIQERLELYMTKFLLDYINKLQNPREFTTKEQQDSRNRLIERVASQNELINSIFTTFKKFHCDHSYPIFVDFVRIIERLEKDDADSYMELMIREYLETQYKSQLEDVLRYINKQKALMSEPAPTVSAPEPASALAPEEAKRGDTLKGWPKSDVQHDDDDFEGFDGKTTDTVTGAVNPLLENDNRSGEMAGKSGEQPDFSNEKAVVVDFGTADPLNGRLKAPEPAPAPATPVATTPEPEAPSAVQRLMQERVSREVSQEIVLPALEVPRPSQSPETSNNKAVYAVIASIALLAVLALSGIILKRRNEENSQPPTPARKVNKPKKFVLTQAELKQMDAAVGLPDAGLPDAAPVQADAAPQATPPGPEAAPTPPPEDPTVNLELTKENLEKIASTAKGRARLRKIALDANGVTIISAKNFPLYNSFRLNLIYQPEDIPEGKNLYLNGNKINFREGKWYDQAGKPVYFYTNNILEVK